MNNTASPLTDFELLDITGKDAAQFLQGQFTCDVKKMQDNEFYLGAVCNPKGQMFANFVIITLDEGFRLRLPKGQGTQIIESLKKYNVFFKAKMLVRTDLQIYANIPQTLKQFQLEPKVLQRDKNQHKLCWSDGRTEVWQEKSTHKNSNISQQWQFADMQAGIYWLSVEDKEQWLPQVIHWQTLQGVSFKKGCYTGQEVIARLQHLGKSKKQLIRIHCKSPLKRGDNIYNEKKNAIAQVLNFDNELGLAILNKEAEILLTETGCPVTKLDDAVITPTHFK